MDTYMLKKIYDIFQVPFYVVEDGDVCFQLPAAEFYQSPLAQDKEFFLQLAEFFKKRKFPILYLENEYIYYGGFLDHEGRYYFVGPLTRKNLEQNELKAYRYKHKLSSNFHIVKCGTDHLSKMLAMLYYAMTGMKIEYMDIPIESRNELFNKWNQEEILEHYQLEQSEEERGHDSRDYENQLLQIIKSGDVAAMKNLMNREPIESDDIGVVAVDNQRRIEYLVVSLITLISRAAIEGGVNPEKAYELSDIYLQQLERCKNVVEMNILGGKASVAFTEIVQKEKKYRSKVICVEKCKDYIAKHLRKDFKVGDIAPAIGMSRTYLAKKFSEVEGMTIQQYIMQERCEHAANLLKYSNYPISIISEYFCFSSQSHFGVQFKKFYGVTPNEYRNQNRYIESYNKGKLT